MSNPKAPTCASCRFYTRQVDINNIGADAGTCRRYPPQGAMLVAHNGQPVSATMIVAVSKDGWCGEHDHRAVLEIAH